MLKESQFFFNPKAPVEFSNFLQVTILKFYTLCAFIRNVDFIKEKEEKKLKINANYLLNHLILNYQEHQGFIILL